MTLFFRVIRHEAMAGSQNMAVDEAILNAVITGNAPWTIRFYQWLTPSLTLGYFQKSSDINRDACMRLGIPVVRRITGGRAVFHDRELTCSVVMPVPQGAAGSVRETFRAINGALLEGLACFGIEGAFSPHRRQKEGSSPLCFEASAQYEVLVKGKKILGSAQTRRKGVLLQQGALPLSLDRDKMLQCFNEDSHAAPGEGEAVKGLLDYTALPLEENTLIEAFVRGFHRALAVPVMEGALEEGELQEARHLEKNRYSNDDWNYRR
jgi:lipoyl(octanoyl) transferase